MLFEPWVAGEFLELWAELLSADEAQGGRSLLAGKIGKTVASSFVTVRDDPRRRGGLGSSRFDDEGLPTHDTASAAREGLPFNGCAYRSSYLSLPSPGASNLFLSPGTMTRAALIADTMSGKQ